MKKKTSFTIFCMALFTALTAAPVSAERIPMPSITVPTAASSGFGGPHVAFTDNVFSLLVNPAAMMHVQQRSFFALSASLLNPQTTFSIASGVRDALRDASSASILDVVDVLSEQNGRIALGLELREIPLSIAWVANGFGFGLWNRSFVQVEVIGDYHRATVYSDIMLPVGFAFSVLDWGWGQHTLDAGFTVKPFARFMVRERGFITDMLDNSDMEFVAPVILGGGLDAGLLYRWAGGLQAGLTFTDIFSRATVAANLADTDDSSRYYVPFAVNAGVSYCFEMFGFARITLAANWRDIGNVFNQNDYLNNRNYLLDFGAGMQLSLFDMLFFRMGMNEMLPAVGFGFTFGALNIDLAYYGRELGYEPGQLSAAAVDLSITIRPGARKRSWAWTEGSIFVGP
ncbi:MAG: hypothetical protein FWC64_04935 [Treponema sp.]|nr:hypothetical protein [Treponema sp.]